MTDLGDIAALELADTQRALTKAILGVELIKGEVGERGYDGDRGPVGPEGAKGDLGALGPKGDKGDKGDQGERGDLGPVGPKGDPGKDGDPGVEGKAAVDGLTWRGTFAYGTTYQPGDVVEWEGSSYVALVVTARRPPDPDWDLLAAKGEAGASGRGYIRGGGGSGSGSALEALDEGVSLSAAVTSFDFAGAGVTATAVGNAITVTVPAGGVNDATYLVGAAHAGLSAEIVVGATPGGELGGTWASPTVDTTHSGSSHAGVVSAHEAAANPHPTYLTQAEGDALYAATGDYIPQGGPLTADLDVGGFGITGTDGAVISVTTVVAANGGTGTDSTGAGFEANAGGLNVGGDFAIHGGNGSVEDGARIETRGGTATDPGRVSITTDNSTGNLGDLVTAQGDGTALWVPPAASGLTQPQVMARMLGA